MSVFVAPKALDGLGASPRASKQLRGPTAESALETVATWAKECSGSCARVSTHFHDNVELHAGRAESYRGVVRGDCVTLRQTKKSSAFA